MYIYFNPNSKCNLNSGNKSFICTTLTNKQRRDHFLNLPYCLLDDCRNNKCCNRHNSGYQVQESYIIFLIRKQILGYMEAGK